MKFRHLLAFSALVLILSLPFVFAGENSTDEIGAVEDAGTLERNVSGNTFADIQETVRSAGDNEVIHLNGTYESGGAAIELNKNLVFDGGSQRATLDGKGASGIFTIDVWSYTITLRNIDFINARGGVFLDGKYSYGEGRLVIDNCSFRNVGGGYAVTCYDCAASNSDFINNSCGAIQAHSATVNGCRFINNSVESVGVLNALTITVDGCSFINNSNSAIYCTDASISNSRFISNTAEYGGAIYLSERSRRLVISNCLFDGNSAVKCGGSIYLDRLYSNGFDDYNAEIIISDSNITDSRAGEKGSAIYCSVCDLTLNSVNINASGSFDEIHQDLGEFKSANSTYHSMTRITEHKATFSVEKLKYYEYGWGGDFSVFLHDDTAGRGFNFAKVKIRVWTGKKYKEYVMPLNYHNYPAAILEIDKRFGVGRHKVEVTPISKYINVKKLTTYFTVKKAKTIVKAPVVKAKYKKSKKFKVTVKLDRYNPLAKVKIKIKVYTGKKSKIYTVKTNRKGVASINTKKLKKGVHKVKISSADNNYRIFKKSKIIIK